MRLLVFLLTIVIFSYTAVSQPIKKYRDRDMKNFQGEKIFSEDFLQKYFGVKLEAHGYRIVEYWEGQGSENIKVKDISGATSKDSRKIYKILDAPEVKPGYRLIEYKTVNDEVYEIRAFLTMDSAQALLDELYKMEVRYTATNTKNSNISWSGIYRFVDADIYVSDRIAEQNVSFWIRFSKVKIRERNEMETKQY
jgi:hypothetical protein